MLVEPYHVLAGLGYADRKTICTLLGQGVRSLLIPILHKERRKTCPLLVQDMAFEVLAIDEACAT
jgi:hypothetical protein